MMSAEPQTDVQATRLERYHSQKDTTANDAHSSDSVCSLVGSATAHDRSRGLP